VTPELHRPIAVDRVGAGGLEVLVEATPAECTALAIRMQLPAVASLTCRFRLQRDNAGSLLAHGHLIAQVIQTCVISLEDFANLVEDRFTVRCVETGQETGDDDPESLDEVSFANSNLDLGETAAQQLALALDPYPRAPDAKMPDISDGQAVHPFAVLEGRQRRH